MLCGILFAAGTACASGRAPLVAPVATDYGPGLSHPPAPDTFSPEGPLRVLHVSPMGPQEKPSQVAIVFDRSIRALGEEGAGPTGFTIEPSVEGRWRWVGTHAVAFEPAAHEFPDATGFRVRVPESVAGIDGSRLQQSVGFEFETQRPTAFVHGCGRNDSITSDARFRLEFSQPTLPSEVERTVHVEAQPLTAAGSWAPWPVRFVELVRDPERGYRVVPQKPWPIGSQVRVRVDSNLRSKAGPLEAGQTTEAMCQTFAPPQADLSCDRAGEAETCSPESSVSLSFENPLADLASLRRIRVEPWVLVAVDEEGGVTLSHLRPHTDYRVTIPAGLRGKFGGVTEEPQVLEFSTSGYQYRALAWLGASGGGYEPSLLGKVPLFIENSPEYFLAARALTPRELFLLGTWDADRPSIDSWELLRTAWVRHGVSPTIPNHLETAIDVKRWLDPTTGTGALILNLSATPLPTAEQAGAELRRHSYPTILSVSDLALTTKLWLDGGLVWVTSLREQVPVAGVRLSLLEGETSTPLGVTGPDGMLKLPAAALDRLWLVDPQVYEGRAGHRNGLALLAEHGGDWTLQRLDCEIVVIAWTPPDPASRLPKLSLFVDRGVYRPGDPLYVKGYAHEQPPGRSHPSVRREVKVSLVSYGNGGAREIESQQVTTNEYGAFSTGFITPPLDKRGEVYVVAALGKRTAGARIVISAFREHEFEVAVTSSQPAAARDGAEFVVSGKYLFGEPMRGARVEWRLTQEPAPFAPPNSEEYVTSAEYLDEFPAYQQKRSAVLPGKGRLSDSGELRVAARLQEDLLTPRRATLSAEVLDVARQVVQNAGSVLVHPARYYVGIKTADQVVAHRPIAVEGVALGWDGTRIPGRRIDISLLRVVEPKANSADGDDEESPNARVLSRIGGCRIESAVKVRRCWLTASKPGSYVVLAESRDGAGSLARAAMPLDVESRADAGHVHHHRSTWSSKPLSLVPALDRAAYHAGDEARLRIESPFKQALAIVTLERDGVYWHETRVVGASSDFRIPISESMGQNATADVLLLRQPGRASVYWRPSNPAEITYAHGSVPIRLAEDERKLVVGIAPSATVVSPGDTIRCDLQVRDRLGRPSPSELAVWAVDEGVLQLTDYQLPNPLQDFTQERPSETSTLDSRRFLGWLVPEGGRDEGIGLGSIGTLGHGAGTPGGRIPARKRGPATVFFEPHLITDAQGRATLSVRLPEQLSRFRVMAVATTKRGDFGSGQADIGVRLPLGARPMMPRFARVGDVFEAGIVVSANANLRAVAKVEASGIALASANRQEVLLEGGHAKDISFRWRAEKVGTARFRYDVAAGDYVDAVTVELPVLQRTRPTTLALYGETRSARGERIGTLPPMARGRSTLKLALANTPLVGLSTAIEGLVTYEHECTEQLASRLLVLGALRPFAERQGAKLPTDCAAQIQAILEQLDLRQSTDGSFGFWASGQHSAWLTAYVAWVLHQSKGAGIAQAAPLLESTLPYLQRAVSGVPRSEAEAVEFRTVLEPYGKAFLVDVLTEIAPQQDIRDDIDDVLASKESLPPFAEAWLLHALRTARHPRKPWKAAATGLANHLLGSLTLAGDRAYVRPRTGDYAEVLDATDRTQALVLRALLAYDRNHPLAPALLKGLLASRGSTSWSSTQASAWALSTLAAYQATHHWAESKSQELVWLGGQPIAEVNLDSKQTHREVSYPWAPRRTSTDLVFEHRGAGSLFYAARLTYEPAQPPNVATSHGFELSHGIAPIPDTGSLPEPDPLGPTLRVDVGQAVLGEIQVFSASPRHQVVIEVPLPAGLEPIAPWLLHQVAPTMDEWSPPLSLSPYLDYHVDVHDDHINFYIEQLEPGIARIPYRARATTQGTFTLPPAHVQEMYTPEHHGSTIASQVTVGSPR